MNRPDPVQHMMVWGASSATLLLIVYFALTGILTFPNTDPTVFGLILAGIFTGFTLGGMAGVIIGTVFSHEQEAVNVEKVENRRTIVLLAVFMMVLIMSRLLIIVAQGAVGHPLLLSFLTATLSALASQHYLLRMETWLKYNKPKRKVKNEATLIGHDGTSKVASSKKSVKTQESHLIKKDVPARLVNQDNDASKYLSEQENQIKKDRL